MFAAGTGQPGDNAAPHQSAEKSVYLAEKCRQSFEDLGVVTAYGCPCGRRLVHPLPVLFPCCGWGERLAGITPCLQSGVTAPWKKLLKARP